MNKDLSEREKNILSLQESWYFQLDHEDHLISVMTGVKEGVITLIKYHWFLYYKAWVDQTDEKSTNLDFWKKISFIITPKGDCIPFRYPNK